MTPNELTIAFAQKNQPWSVPYLAGVLFADESGVPHILATHNTLHAAKTVGKLAAVFEKLDHKGGQPTVVDVLDIGDMAADLITAALRYGNLYGIDIAKVLVERVEEKNGVNLLNLELS